MFYFLVESGTLSVGSSTDTIVDKYTELQRNFQIDSNCTLSFIDKETVIPQMGKICSRS